MTVEQLCYRCSNEANSNEHVPPKCLFPESKDVFGINFRSKLITVPSCEIHNNSKSKDDEFLMICLASSVQANPIGYFHLKTKVKRAILKKHKDFMEQIIRNTQNAIYTNQSGNSISVLKGETSTKRLNYCFESIAYGLYFEENKKAFKGEVQVVNDFVNKELKNQESFIKLLELTFKNDKTKHEIKGGNPEIFSYQFTDPDRDGLISLKMTFYEGINIYVGFAPENTNSTFDLSLALINAGQKITFQIGDEKIVFEEDETKKEQN